MAEVVGLVASIVQLLGALKSAYRGVSRGSRVKQKLDMIVQRVEPLKINLLEEPHRARFSRETLAALGPTLTSIKQILEAIPHPSRLPRPASRSIWAFLQSRALIAWYDTRHGFTVDNMLDDVLMLLNSFSDLAMLTLVVLPRWSPECICLPEPCPILVGLDRAAEVLQFIMTPPRPLVPLSSQPMTSSAASTPQLRIVGIVGQGGLGKHTLLVHILNELRDSFDTIAYVRFEGGSLENTALCKAQSTLLYHLGGPRREFRAVHEGMMELTERLRELQRLGKSVCIGIENVWRAEDLEGLLPRRLATLLPQLNVCIIITSRVKSIANRLRYHCGEDLRALSFEPQLLKDSASRQLLLSHFNLGSLGPDEEQLIDRIFPFCGGLPLALELAGRFSWRLCGAQCWEDWMRDMLPEKAGIPLEKIDHILELSYMQLQSQSQEALVEIGSCLFGWPWEVVENIVGSMAMSRLHDLSLIDSVITRGVHTSERAVRMHDLIRKLVITKQVSMDVVKWDPERWSSASLLSSKRVHKFVKFLRLDVKKAEESEMLEGEKILHMDGNWFEHMQKLKVLEISGSFICTQLLLLPTSLCFLKLECNNHLTSVNFPSCLKQLELKGCVALTELPASIYECNDLRYLCIIGSPSLQGFRPRSNWRKLSRLWLERCANITDLPGDLANLEHLTLVGCAGLHAIPEVYHKLHTQKVYIAECPFEWPPSQNSTPFQRPLRMNTEGNSTTSSISTRIASPSLRKVKFRCMQDLQSLHVQDLETLGSVTLCNCQDVAALWSILVKMTSLKELSLENCEWSKLEEFPEEIQSLRMLKLKYNQMLSDLPKTLCNLRNVHMLGLYGCTKLQNLPEEIGILTRLEKLGLQGCESLVGLPSSICELKSLKELDMTRCYNLKTLPLDMNKMTSLTCLSLQQCISLQGLPNTLCNVTLLEVLNMAGCSALEALPENMGNLPNLRIVLLSSCRTLRRLPHSLCRRANQISVLDLRGCDTQLDIPNELRGYVCLKL